VGGGVGGANAIPPSFYKGHEISYPMGLLGMGSSATDAAGEPGEKKKVAAHATCPDCCSDMSEENADSGGFKGLYATTAATVPPPPSPFPICGGPSACGASSREPLSTKVPLLEMSDSGTELPEGFRRWRPATSCGFLAPSGPGYTGGEAGGPCGADGCL